MGTMIQAQQLDEAAFRGSQFAKHPKDLRQNCDALNITQPHIVQAIQRQYLEAGADIIKTNTFNSNAISTLDYGLENHVHALNLAGAQIARQVVEEFDAAIMNPPYFKIGADSVHALAMCDAYRSQPNIYTLFLSRAAELLQIKRSTLGDRINRCGLGRAETSVAQETALATPATM